MNSDPSLLQDMKSPSCWLYLTILITILGLGYTMNSGVERQVSQDISRAFATSKISSVESRVIENAISDGKLSNSELNDIVCSIETLNYMCESWIEMQGTIGSSAQVLSAMNKETKILEYLNKQT